MSELISKLVRKSTDNQNDFFTNAEECVELVLLSDRESWTCRNLT